MNKGKWGFRRENKGKGRLLDMFYISCWCVMSDQVVIIEKMLGVKSISASPQLKQDKKFIHRILKEKSLLTLETVSYI